MKKIISILSSLFVFSMLLFPKMVSASSNIPTVEELNDLDREELIQSLTIGNSVSIDEIRELETITLYELTRDQGEIIDITEVEDILSRPDNTMIRPLLMPTSDFTMTVVAQRINEKSGDNFKFTATGNWKINPVWQLVDTIALSWDGGFSVYNDYSYLQGFSGTNQYLHSGVRKSISSTKGVSHNLDLKAGAREEKAVLVAKVVKSNSSGYATAVGRYGHVELKGSISSVSFTASTSDKPSISFTGTVGARINPSSPGYTTFQY